MPDSRDKRRWYQFSLRALLVTATLAVPLLAGLVNWLSDKKDDPFDADWLIQHVQDNSQIGVPRYLDGFPFDAGGVYPN